MQQNPFDLYTEKYEKWFEETQNTFQSEILALKQLIPQNQKGLEVGIGSGIFAHKLGIETGIDPSENMLHIARSRNLNVIRGVAEELPFLNERFDYVVFITSICFISNPQKALDEAYRVVKKGGSVIIAFIDKTSALGKTLESEKNNSNFYKSATFYSSNEIKEFIEKAGFRLSETLQTLTIANSNQIENPIQGSGKGGFVIHKAIK